ncbi:nucleotide sugar dehydrogenase [Clostridium sp. 19966]|uniref:nucleotide sugar dehydrogenase n=1 Tax=Clostridium sp. 19966 TaxID=2768166 RepID=UPI0028ED3473|nr:nucleotide sugar dehydrogenase [Clostridium sp. 19966]
MTSKENLLYKIQNKTAIVGVIGLGYVGLPMAVEIAKSGYQVLGLDVDENKVSMINNGINYIDDINNDEFNTIVRSHLLKAYADFQLLKDVDIVLICVPTPLDIYEQPNISYIKAAAESINNYIHADMLIVLESTTYPGTTEELVLPILESHTMLKPEQDFFLAFSPERVDPGNTQYKTSNTPKIIGGLASESTEVADEFYRNILKSETYKVSSAKVAEMEKILENTYRNINIGLINEMAIICHKMNINIWEVIDAAKTKPYGFTPFYPGPGLGGHCIPLDPYYLSWKTKEYGYHARMIETSGQINDYMPRYIVDRTNHILNKFNLSLRDSNILILGIAYKNDINDYRESPALKIIEALNSEGAKVSYCDPYISSYRYKGAEYTSITLNKEALQKADLVILITNHRLFDYNFIQQNSKFIFDTRNALKNVSNRDNIELL